jgi:hypothetical protein
MIAAILLVLPGKTSETRFVFLLGTVVAELVVTTVSSHLSQLSSGLLLLYAIWVAGRWEMWGDRFQVTPHSIQNFQHQLGSRDHYGYGWNCRVAASHRSSHIPIGLCSVIASSSILIEDLFRVEARPHQLLWLGVIPPPAPWSGGAHTTVRGRFRLTKRR